MASERMASTELCLSWLRDGKGAASLLLHGFTGAPACWQPVVAAIPGHQPIATLPLPGHCGVTVPGSDFVANLDAMASAIARDAGARVHLVGYSMGARIALGLALEQPELFVDVTLIGVHPGLARPADRAQRRAADQRFIDLLRDAGITSFVDVWQGLPMWASQARVAPAARTWQRAIRLAHDPAGLAAALAGLGLGVMPCYRDRLAELAMPVVLVVGAEDKKFTALAQEMVRDHPALDLRIIPDAGHNLLLEAPVALAATL